MTIYGLTELLKHVPEHIGYQAFVGLLRNLKASKRLPPVDHAFSEERVTFTINEKVSYTVYVVAIFSL